ncbi:hypothetical protein LTR10_019759 [Elasticomyces elasticus]|uniref:2-deoxy-D-gluconate 3-dehydrogenase n=1 Tax=Exophiala sideris TaxID=1016849 RepID=A0ABR0JD95_9EURO|nr:hypothetical protein LTR10_019759 [Elasticomyces elasticus]KAK5032114.1 hypothetical protein LTS07_004736 [Exophiala sideris]KAK5041041.1 hypothetical protein LTR13_003343 [Exophiala sideris]KAK5061625.1 hypothetical protein LTR69_004807 [Exophiala sideris]KAK5184324.1 hypothetical protein LTR44_002997 [Eurotiomycetes sp. CCFEE 6388]
MTAADLDMDDIYRLNGKTAIVTGATGGIGLTTTLAMAQSGANIVSIQIANDPQSSVLQEGVRKFGRTIQVFECNLLDQNSIIDTFQEIWAAGVVPDILYHAAGITHHAKIEETTLDALNRVLDLNVRAAYIVSQEFGKQMLKLGRPGKIIHIASMAAELIQTNISVYASSKAFVRALTRALSNEWASKGITCNCIAPGWINTPMCKPLYDDAEFSRGVVDRTSIRRWGEPEDLKGLVVFLASRASDFITGENIVIDGGVIGR